MNAGTVWALRANLGRSHPWRYSSGGVELKELEHDSPAVVVVVLTEQMIADLELPKGDAGLG